MNALRRQVLAALFLAIAATACTHTQIDYPVRGLSQEDSETYDLDPDFYKKSLRVQNILIATSAKVEDRTIQETAYLYDHLMQDLRPDIAEKVRAHGVLCILAAHDEMTSDIPHFKTDKTGDDLEFYNWRKRGFLTEHKGRKVVFFAEEDVMEYKGGMQLESILIHEFGHVVHKAGFPDELDERLVKLHKRVMEAGLWHDGRAAQRYNRIESASPVSLLDALKSSFPDLPPELLEACLHKGDILVNGKASSAEVNVTKDDKVLIVFGGPKPCYGTVNRGEYFAEMYQNWYDTNRTMDHDHNHIHTRAQLIEYDKDAAAYLKDITTGSDWRFVSPRERAGRGHLKGYDPSTAPVVKNSDLIKKAASDYYDTYWKDYWQRLADKHGIKL